MPYGLVKNGTQAVAGSASGTSFDLTAEPELIDILAVEEDGSINLAAEEAGSYFLVTSDLGTKIADVTVGEGEYTIASTGAADEALTLVSIGSDSAVVTTDIPATIAIDESSSTFAINGDVYVATASPLTIEVTAEGSTLFFGTVHLDSTGENAPESVTIGEQTITATGTELDVSALGGEAQSVADIDVGETFTIGEDSYEQTAIGLIKNNSQLLADSTGDDYTYDLANDNWSNITILDGDTINITSDTAEGTVFVNADKTAIVANYADGVLTAGDADAAAEVTVSVDNGVDVNIGGGFAKIETQVVDETQPSGFSLIGFIVGVIKQTASFFGIKFGSSGASVSVDGAEEVELTDGTIDVESGTTVAVTDDEGNTNTVKVADSGYTVGINDSGIPSISGIEDLSGISVAGIAAVDITPSATADTTYNVGSQEFTTRSKSEGNTLTFTLEGDSVDDDDTSTKVTAVDNLEQGAIMTVVDTSGDDDTSVDINGVNYETNDNATTVIGTVSEETGRLSSRRVDNGSYYVVIENNSAQVFALIPNGDGTFNVDTEAGDIGFNAISNDEAYDGSGSIVLKNDENTLIVPTANNVLIFENRDATPVTVSSATDDYVSELLGLTAYLADSFTIKLMNVEGDTLSEATEVPAEGIIGIPNNMTLEIGELKIDNADTNTASVVFSDESVALVGSNITVTGAADITFALGTTENAYTINGVVYTAAEVNDTVAIADDTITLTTIGDGMTATGEGSFVLTAGGVYTVNDDTFDVVADATIEDGMLVDGTVKIYGTITVNEKDIELTADADGVEVTVANTELTSITKLTTGGIVDYDGSKYEMTSDGRLKVTEANGEIKFYAGGEEVNILDPGAATAYEEVTEDGSIELTPEVLAKLAESGAVEFGTTDSDTGEITPLATLTEGEEDGAYNFASEPGMADVTVPVEIDASGVDDMTELTTDFDAAVTTPANTETVIVNDTPFASADGQPLTVEANADGPSELIEGTVALDPTAENSAVTPAGDDEPAVEVTAGDGITAKVEAGELTEIGDIDDGDSFKVGDEEYTKAPAGLVNDGMILDDSRALESADPDALADSDSWTVMLALTEEGELDLTDDTLTSNGEVTVVDSVDNPSKIYGSATYTEGEEGTAFTFDVSGYADEIAAVKLGSADATLTITGANGITVTTEESSATYTVNGTEYTAVSSPLELNATAEGATLTAGTVTVTGELTTSAGNTVTVAEDEDGVTCHGCSGRSCKHYRFDGRRLC